MPCLDPTLFDGIDLNKLEFPDEIYEFNFEDLEEPEYIFSNDRTIVKKYWHRPSDKEIVVKFINLSRGSATEWGHTIEKLKREVEIHKKLRGFPHIVYFYGLCFYRDQALICMESMDYSLANFREACAKSGLSFDESVFGSIAVSVLDALIECKNCDVIHRDIKPANILINRDGQVKLCDFGVSKILNGSPTSTLVGTIEYWPPERFTRPREPYDERADGGAMASLY